MKSSRKIDVAIIEMQAQLTASELVEIAKKKRSVFEQILREAIKNLPKERHCLCASALKNARLRG